MSSSSLIAIGIAGTALLWVGVLIAWCDTETWQLWVPVGLAGAALDAAAVLDLAGVA